MSSVTLAWVSWPLLPGALLSLMVMPQGGGLGNHPLNCHSEVVYLGDASNYHSPSTPPTHSTFLSMFLCVVNTGESGRLILWNKEPYSPSPPVLA